MQGRNGSLFFCMLGNAMGALMSGILTMPLERNLLVREQNSGMYRISRYCRVLFVCLFFLLKLHNTW